MKLVKHANGKKTVKMSQAEWLGMGHQGGWLKEAGLEKEAGIFDWFKSLLNRAPKEEEKPEGQAEYETNFGEGARQGIGHGQVPDLGKEDNVTYKRIWNKLQNIIKVEQPLERYKRLKDFQTALHYFESEWESKGGVLEIPDSVDFELTRFKKDAMKSLINQLLLSDWFDPRKMMREDTKPDHNGITQGNPLFTVAKAIADYTGIHVGEIDMRYLGKDPQYLMYLANYNKPKGQAALRAVR